jgi:uncharacterized membrane protein
MPRTSLKKALVKRMIRQLAVAWPLAALVFLAMDAVWLSLMAPLLYRPEIGHLLREGFDLSAALLFYLLYVSGMVAFAIAPAISGRQPLHAGWRGALLGAVAYGTYDLTNQATLRDWSWLVTLADLGWGMSATAIASVVASAATSAIFQGSAKRP